MLAAGENRRLGLTGIHPQVNVEAENAYNVMDKKKPTKHKSCSPKKRGDGAKLTPAVEWQKHRKMFFYVQ